MPKILRYAALAWVAALFVTAALPAAAAERAPTYTFAVQPAAPPVVIYKKWLPLVDRITRETGYDLHLKVYDKMSDFEQDIWAGAPDFIFSSPIQLVVAHSTREYTPLVRGAELVSLALVVRKDSPVRNIEDLSGKRIAFVGNKNICSVFMRHMLNKQKNHFSYFVEYTGSTKNVIKSVQLGKTDAGAIFLPELQAETEQSRGMIRILMETRKIAPHPISAKSTVPQEVQRKVKQAVLRIAASPDGTELLKGLRLATPVAADYQRDYQALEEVDVIGLTNWGK